MRLASCKQQPATTHRTIAPSAAPVNARAGPPPPPAATAVTLCSGGAGGHTHTRAWGPAMPAAATRRRGLVARVRAKRGRSRRATPCAAGAPRQRGRRPRCRGRHWHRQLHNDASTGSSRFWGRSWGLLGQITLETRFAEPSRRGFIRNVQQLAATRSRFSLAACQRKRLGRGGERRCRCAFEHPRAEAGIAPNGRAPSRLPLARSATAHPIPQAAQ